MARDQIVDCESILDGANPLFEVIIGGASHVLVGGLLGHRHLPDL
jgi:hypothetical protein